MKGNTPEAAEARELCVFSPWEKSVLSQINTIKEAREALISSLSLSSRLTIPSRKTDRHAKCRKERSLQ